MGQNFFDFKPTHTLFMAVNHLPEVKSGGDGFWRRLRKIDFRKTIPVERRKENFAATMVEAEGPGILQWMIDGAVRITDRGMSEPDSIKLSTQTYRHEEDHIAKFLDEKTILADQASVGKATLFQAYREWCDENGERPITQNQLGRELKNRTTATETTSAGFKMFVGIDLLKIDSHNNVTTVSDIMEIADAVEDWWDK
jgi:P4 family phage/plasmid primase-like protien